MKRKTGRIGALKIAVVILLSALLLCHPKGEKDPLKPITDFIISDFKAVPPAITGAGDTAVVSMKLVSLVGLSPQDQTILFSVVPDGIGSLSPATDSTDINGVARTVFTAAAASGQALIISEFESVRDTVSVRIGSATGRMTADPSRILADGISTSTITVVVKGESNELVEGATVTFGAEEGRLSRATAASNADGEATTVLTSLAAAGDMFVNVWASATTSSGDESATTAARPKEAVIIDYEELGRRLAADTSFRRAFTDPLGSTPEMPELKARPRNQPGRPAAARPFLVVFSDTVMVHFKGVTVKVTSADDTLLANGVNATTITANLTETVSGQPVSNALINMSTSLGQLTADSVRTDDSGDGRVTLLSGLTSGTATVTAAYGPTLEAETGVKFLPVTPTTIELEVSPKRILADGVSQATLTATVTDDNQNPVQDGTTVRFIILPGGSGSVVGTALTVDGVAVSKITSGVDGDTVRVEASIVTSRDTAEVFFKAMVLALSSDPTVLAADGKAKATITALLRDEDNIPIEGKQIDFRTTIGTIPSPRTTDQNGLAQTTLTSEQENGVAVITAETGNLSTTFPVAFSGITMTVTASPSNLVADGSSTSTITATLVDPNGDPVANRLVTFQVESAEISPKTITTKPDGKAIAYLKSSTAGTKTVTAEGAGASGEVDVTFTGFTFNLTVDPQSITAGLDSTEITAQLLDSDLDPVTGAVVNFSATLGQIDDSGVTNSLGQARVWFSSTSTGTAIITASALLGDTLEVSSSISVEIGSSPSANLVLTANPRVVKVNGGTSTLTAVVTDANLNPVANASVGFRLLSGPHGGESLNPATATTSGNGLATTIFTAGSIASTNVNDVDIMAFIPGVGVESEVVELTIAGAPKHITVGYSLPPKTQDGSYSLPVAAIVSDISGNAVVDGTLVLFSINPVIGAITSPVATNNGQATTSLIYPTSSAGTAVSLLAESGGISADAVNLVLPGASGVISSVELEAADISILADGQSQTSVTALVKDPNGSPVGDVVVQFQSELGSIQSPVKSEPQYLSSGVSNPDWGKATTTLTSRADTTINGLLDQVTATAGGIDSDPIDIQYRGISLAVWPADESITVDGASTTISAVLKEKASNVPISSARVNFGTDLGTIIGSATTDASGVATTSLTSAGQTGTANINAIYGPNIVKTTIVEFVAGTIEPGDPASITIAIGPRTDNKDGTYSAPVSAIVSDASGNPVADGLEILFSLPNPGDMVILSSKTTVNGIATTTITYPDDDFGLSIQIRARYGNNPDVTEFETLP